MNLAFVLVLLPLAVLFGLAFCFLNLSQKLFFFEGNAFSIKFDSFKLFAVFPRQIVVLLLSIFELLSLELVFFVNGHYGL